LFPRIVDPCAPARILCILSSYYVS